MSHCLFDVHDILVKLLELNIILQKSYREASLNYITEYIYDVLSLYNKFYNNNNILKENDNTLRETYLALSKIVYTIVHHLLDILAIDEVDRM